MALARIYGIYPAVYLFVRHWHLGAHEHSTLVSAPLSRTPATDLTSHPFHIFAKFRSIRLPEWNPLLNRPTRPPSVSPTTLTPQFPTKNPSDCPSGRPFQTFQQKFLPDPPDGVLLKISNQPFIYIYHLGSTMNLPNKTPSTSPS